MSGAPDEAATGAPAEGSGLRSRFAVFREKYHLAIEVAFFFAGFLFDVLLLHRIDSLPLLIHQGTYLVLTAGLVFVDFQLHARGKEPGGFWGKVASYRLWVMHFFLGTLLNAFIVFYFRSSSGVMATIFLVALVALIVLNELPRFRERGPVVRVALLSFCITSYLAYLIPVVWGVLRSWQYYLSLALGAACTVGLWKIFTRFGHDPTWTFRRAVAPGLALQAFLFIAYLGDAIPPVPLSLKSIAMYNEVIPERDGQERHYRLRYVAPPAWKVWASVPSDLLLAPGEKAWVFVRIFAPARFQDSVAFAWDFDDPKQGWVAWGKPFSTRLSGGSEKGYRTYAYTSPSRAGTYRVRVLTADEREIGRKTFRVDFSTEETERVLAEEVD